MNEGNMNVNLRSQRVLAWPECSIQRTLYKSMGYTDYDLERPLVGIANSWNRVVPGHYNLQLDVMHAHVALRDPVARGDDTELDGRAARGAHALAHSGGEAAQVLRARHDVRPRAHDADERLGEIVVGEPGRLEHRARGGAGDSDLQGVASIGSAHRTPSSR